MREHRAGRPAIRSGPARREMGTGYAPAHHGELLQGVFADQTGRSRRALVTLPCPGLGTRATFYPSQRHWGIVGTPELIKVRRAALLTLREFTGAAAPAKGGRVEIVSSVPRGIGMGSSTSDVVAAIRAVADYHGVPLAHEEEARIAVLAECASDSVMIDDRVVLFAHRDGEVLETLGYRLPPMVVLGCDAQPGVRVNTLGLPPAEYTEHDAGTFQALRGALRRAVAVGDVALLGRVATASARINQRYLPKPPLADLIAISRAHGGYGVQVAHSGTVAGLIFDSRDPNVRAALGAARAELTRLGLTVTAELDTAAGPAAVAPAELRVPA